MTKGTVGTPIGGGIGSGLSVAEPLPYTWLSLARYARIMGVAPPHFFGCYSQDAFPILGGCSTVWPRHSWQDSGRTSREELAYGILEAEQEIAEVLGFNLAPTYVMSEVYQYPKFWDRSGTSWTGGVGNYNMAKRINVKTGKLIAGGVRGVTLIGTATTAGASLSYTDEDGDGFSETATVTMVTTETDACELRAFVPGTGGAEEWEIRPPKSKSISSGTLTMVFNSWLFVNPDVDSSYPTEDGYRAIDVTSINNYLTSVDIYRVYTDNSQESARFFWESAGTCSICDGTGCEACSLTYQGGCTYVGNVDEGVLVPVPAAYDSVEQQWTRSSWSVNRDPDMVRVSYYAGAMSQDFLRGKSCDPLDNKYARAISWIATARLDKPPCSCPEVIKTFEALREDLSAFGTEAVSHILAPRLSENPFGTRRGEVMAWNLIGRMARERIVGVAVI